MQHAQQQPARSCRSPPPRRAEHPRRPVPPSSNQRARCCRVPAEWGGWCSRFGGRGLDRGGGGRGPRGVRDRGRVQQLLQNPARLLQGRVAHGACEWRAAWIWRGGASHQRFCLVWSGTFPRRDRSLGSLCDTEITKRLEPVAFPLVGRSKTRGAFSAV